MSRKNAALAAILLGFIFIVSSCHTAVVYRHPASTPVAEKRVGPPPHAPAHGYRHKHPDGTRLEYDSRLGVYVVLGHTNLYFSDGMYYRPTSVSWEISAKIGSGWKPVSEKRLPPGLRATKVCKAKKAR